MNVNSNGNNPMVFESYKDDNPHRGLSSITEKIFKLKSINLQRTPLFQSYIRVPKFLLCIGTTDICNTIIQGILEFKLTEPLLINRIFFEFNGYMKVKGKPALSMMWRGRSTGPNGRIRRGVPENIVHNNQEHAMVDQVEAFETGVHTIPFEFIIWGEIPPTYHSRIASIFYSISVEIHSDQLPNNIHRIVKPMKLIRSVLQLHQLNEPIKVQFHTYQRENVMYKFKLPEMIFSKENHFTATLDLWKMKNSAFFPTHASFSLKQEVKILQDGEVVLTKTNSQILQTHRIVICPDDPTKATLGVALFIPKGLDWVDSSNCKEINSVHHVIIKFHFHTFNQYLFAYEVPFQFQNLPKTKLSIEFNQPPSYVFPPKYGDE